MELTMTREFGFERFMDVEKETAKGTKAALEEVLNVRLGNVPRQSTDPEFIRYHPLQRSAAAFSSGAKGRIIRMAGMPTDPLELPKFKHRRIPRGSGSSPPVPVMHSPPRPVTAKDQRDWNIPPCISNYKNPKGYAIPLDKRLAADGRGLQEVRVNDNFARLIEVLHVTEEKAREDVELRSKVRYETGMMETERKERELRAVARKARSERPEESREDREERLKRDKILEERRRERRLEAKDAAVGKKSKITRDRDRDIGEKVALGMASTGAGRGREVMYDQRLFNQEKGMDSGFGTDDRYNVYDKGLFTAQPALSTLYRPSKDRDAEMYGGDADEQLQEIMKTACRFKPDKRFSGASARGCPRDRPVEFEKDAEEADPFGLDQFLAEVKKGKKAMDRHT